MNKIQGLTVATVRMTKHLGAGLLLAFLVGNILAKDADARPFRETMIPNLVNGCTSCHSGSASMTSRNPFGLDVEALLTTTGDNGEAFWGPELAAMDSDGDGFTNGEELGDPYGAWEELDAAPGLWALMPWGSGLAVDLGHPGDAEIVPKFHVVPQEWPAVTATPDSLVIFADVSNPLGDLRVVFETSLETMDQPARLVLDASALGAEAAIPFDRIGDAEYAASGTVTPVQGGWFTLPVLLETDGGDAYLSHYLRVVVLPTRDWPLFGDDELMSDWQTVGSSVAAFDPRATTSVFEGHTSLAVQPKRSITLPYLTWSPADAAFGYRLLHLAFQPGELDEAGDPPTLNVRIKDAVSEEITIVPLLSVEEAPLDLDNPAWQTVEIPLGDRPVQSIAIEGNLKGTFYLDDIRLVPENLVPTAVAEQRQNTTPERFGLDQNFPNPFNSGTVIRFALPTSDQVEIALYNLAGQKVLSLVEGSRQAGSYTLFWDGLDAGGQTMASGIYMYRMQTGKGLVRTRRLMLLK